MRSLLLVLLALFPTLKIHAQGCSDAGFCSIGDLKSSTTSSTNNFKNSFTVGLGYGMGLETTQTITPYLDYQRKLSDKFVLQGKITAGFATGDLGDNFGAGDIFLSGSYTLFQKESFKISALAGGKIPLNNSNNKNDDDLPLPLDYQSSLATYDVIAGARVGINKFEFNIGLQMPFVQQNENTFFPSLYDDSLAYEYSSTNRFVRKGDVLFRAGYQFGFKENTFLLKPNLLAIYHLGNDTYEDLTGKRVTIEDSEGLTLNAGVVAAKHFKNQHELEALIAFPLIVREVRPDGLTRSLVVNLQYKIPF